MMVVLLLSAVNRVAGTSVTTLGGGPNYYANDGGAYFGSTNSLYGTVYSQFHTPSGIALDSSGNYLFVADRDNNEIRELDLVGGQTYTFTTNLVNRPVGVAVDGAGNVYVLNQGSVNAAGLGTNGNVLEFDGFGNLLATNSGTMLLTNAAGIALDTVGDIYVTVNSNTLIRIAGATITNIATIAIAGTSLQGIVVKHNGLIAAVDSGRNGIYLIDPSKTTGNVTTNAGFNGAGDGTGVNNHGVQNASAKFFQPSGVAEAGDGSLIVADYGNNRLKVVTASGITTNLYGVSSNFWSSSFPGWSDGTVLEPDQVGDVQARLPFGVAIATDGTIYTTEDYYHIIRHVTGAGFVPPLPSLPAAPTILTVTTNFGQVTLTWSTVSTATSYNVKRSPSSGGPYANIATNITATSYTDTSVINGATYYYVVSAVNAGGEGANSAQVGVIVPIPPPPAPLIGWYDYEGNTQTGFFSVLHPVSIFIANNDPLIGINPTTNGVATYYIAGSNPLSGAPGATNGTTPPFYQDGILYPGLTPVSLPATTNGDLIIKAVNVGPGGTSPVTTAEFLFQVGGPSINGLNGANFTVSDVTSNVNFYYTTDGSMPTNDGSGTAVGPITNNPATISLNITTNVTFTVRAFRKGYAPSSPAIQVFSPGAFSPNNTISFGFASGEASSAFIASPGQTFYAPVTLSILSTTTVYSLQFNLTVTNLTGPQITPGAFSFATMLKKPDPANAGYYLPIPTYAFADSSTVVTNGTVTNSIVTYEGTNFMDLETTNLSINLLGVGWLERVTKTNLYNTLSQDLIQYSQAHDTLFVQGNGQIILGGYAFQVPTNAALGQTYQIQIGRPSATSDGVGAPGSSVFIYAPTNGSPTNGTINSVKTVTAGQFKYIVGDAYPFRWFNAGDFGNTNLENADVQQVFNSAVYFLNSPFDEAPGSDFSDVMDSCGTNLAYPDNNGFYTNSTGAANLNALFDGNDTTINNMAYGDGQLDVCDVYVTYRRSLDPSLTWFSRFWTNGVRVAVATPNVFNPSVASKSSSLIVSKFQPAVISITNQPKVNFTAGDFQGSPGQTVQIPITAKIFGNYPLRVLMLNLTVVPLDGSPALTTPVQFTPNSALGQPTITDSQGNGNYAATWLNSTIAGLTGTASIGTLTVTIPASASSLSSYAIHFDHASGSPNGIASFPKQTLTGLMTLSSRTNSTYNDGIPDSWRLRYFGTTNNILSVSNACPSGDGVNNWKKFVAGVDPTAANDFPSTNPLKPAPSGSTASIHWPTVSGVQYVIQRSASLFPGNWSNITTNTGTGTDMEFDDTSAGSAKFYRVLILH
jgi:hypothetical protein